MKITIEQDGKDGTVKEYKGITSMLLICDYVDSDGNVQPLRIIPGEEVRYAECMAIAQQRAAALGAKNG